MTVSLSHLHSLAEIITHEIHTSEWRKFNRCRLAWHWSYRNHLEPLYAPRALEFGTAFHIAMQHFYEPQLWSNTTPEQKFARALAAMEDTMVEQRERFLIATNQKGMLSPALGDDYEERIQLARGMLRHYAFYVHPQNDNWFRPVRVEIPFRVPLYDPYDLTEPIYCTSSPECGQEHPNPALITYDGRVDMLIEDLQNGGLLCWDHKTAGSLTPDDWFLQMDDQVASYVMALSLMLKLDIKGFVYAEILKGFPREPDMLQRRTKGRIISTDKRTLTDLPTALTHIKDSDPDGYHDGSYDEYLEYLLSDVAPQFFKRFHIYQSPRKLAVVASNISNIALDMCDPNIRIYPQVSRPSCSYCEFKAPCQSKFEGEDYQYGLNSMYRKKEAR